MKNSGVEESVNWRERLAEAETIQKVFESGLLDPIQFTHWLMNHVDKLREISK